MPAQGDTGECEDLAMTTHVVSTQRLKVYLAGPEVFLPNAADIANEKREICREFGFDSIFPSVAPSESEPFNAAEGGRVFAQCVAWMLECDLMVANMTPFRGVSMDVGTAIEMGFMHASDRPVFAYTNDPRDYDERVRVTREDDMAIESFHFADNLMCEGVVRHWGSEVVRVEAAGRNRFSEMQGFTRCVSRAADIMRDRAASAGPT